MWVHKDKIVKFQATTQIIIVALFYKINPAQNATIIPENTKNWSNSVPCTIEIKFKLVRNSHLLLYTILAISQSAKPFVQCYYKLLLCKVLNIANSCSQGLL